MLHLSGNNKRLIMALIFIALVVAALIGAVVANAEPACPVCDYTIELVEANHVGNEPGWDWVRWDYEAKSKSGKDTSHWNVTVGECYQVIECGPMPCERVDDPTTGINGVKWEITLQPGESANLWFVTRIRDGETRHALVQAAAKAGQDICYYEVDGPVCGSATLVKMLATSAEGTDYSTTIVAVAGIVALVIIAYISTLKRD
jgi:hypothetical protein